MRIMTFALVGVLLFLVAMVVLQIFLSRREKAEHRLKTNALLHSYSTISPACVSAHLDTLGPISS